jgi:hypothetical protein
VTARKLEQEKRIELKTGGSLDFWSLESEGAGRGRKYRRIIIDEAAQYSRLETAFTEDIRPTLTDLRGDAWFLSTPRGRNAFWRFFQLGRSADHPEWASWQFPSSANPFLPPGEVEAARKGMPERAYAQEYAALFIEESGLVFRKVLDAIDRGRVETPIITDHRLAFALGVDVARHHDWTVLTILTSSGTQVYFERFKEISWPRIIAAIEHATKVMGEQANKRLERVPGAIPIKVKRPDVILDTTGVGDVVYDALRSRNIYTIPYTFTHASKQRLIDNLAMQLENGAIRLMDIPEQENELLSYEYSKTPAGNTVMGAPPGSHDDCVCALALSAWGIGSRGCYSAGAW